ncbi:MAG: hypothetical protein ACK4IK_05675 [Bacteroidia bacterium]
MLEFFDIIVGIIYLVLIFIILHLFFNARDPKNEYLFTGIYIKIIGGISLGLVFYYYYGYGGDTQSYFETSKAFTKLFFKDPISYYKALFAKDYELPFYFDKETGYIWFAVNDKYAIFTSKIFSLINIFTFNSYIGLSILTSVIVFSGYWKLFYVFKKEFPDVKKNLAIAIFFIPSVVFWASGILKDSLILSSAGWFTYCIYKFFIEKTFKIKYLLGILFFIFIIINIKPYVIIALLPGTIIWIFYDRAIRIKNNVIKFFIIPFFFIISIGIGIFTITQFGSVLGDYSIENINKKAIITQQDLKRIEYSANSFDIGEFDGSFQSYLSKAPLAINAALFRPYIWEARNPVMILAGLENIFILGLTLFLLLKLKFIGFFKYIFKNPLLLFSILFSLIFAYSVGMTISNFGALVRLKTPAMPFYVSSIFIIFYLYSKEKNKKRIN